MDQDEIGVQALPAKAVEEGARTSWMEAWERGRWTG